ncbi:interferon-activable protein 203-like isoform X2 [Chionomys nivalis]|uniref:interferon-activable protein 203-like isoform X2 n=1 Tax=Chionomys nivalis TaxID=269649 RepID=UPI002596572A|nr:interferon-activable protein 203-like isoform X2 [Chionomys nivalis]
MSEYKKIVLLKGLERMEDYHFRTIKSLLKKELHLSDNMQKNYDKIQIADKMEETFPEDAGLNKLIEICQEIDGLRGLVENLKKERAKVKKPNEEKVKTALKQRKQEEPSSSQPLSTDNEPNKNKHSSKKKSKTPTETEGGKERKLTQEESQLPEAPESNIQKDEHCLQTPHKPPPIPPNSSSNKKQKRKSIINESTVKTEISQEEQQLLELPATSNSSDASELHNHQTPRKKNIPKEPAKEEGYQQGPKEVMVLKVTEPFTYDLIDDKRMFHATVATENEFFRVKIFDPVLEEKFIPNKIIAISNYFGSKGFLEIHEASCVSDVDPNRIMVISQTLRQNANTTPKIKDIFLKPKGTYLNGEFVVYEKTERNSCIYYGIEDGTGKMEVVVYGKLTSIKCEPGQKLGLVCFELSSSEDKWQLKSVIHSFMQVTDVKKKVP